MPEAPAPRGLYAHVPFCFHKCHYCDFYSIVDRQDRQAAFVSRLVAELKLSQGFMSEPIETVFVGGGTPTLLAPPLWRELLAAMRADLPIAPGAEITVEANPETVTDELAGILSEGGVNRVSVGCQSFDPRHLATLERWHEPASVPRSVAALRRAGIDDLNLDLIFGIPGQTLGEWADDLDRAVELGPDHVSCYGLTYEPNTALTARMRAGAVTPADEDLEAEMYALAMDRLDVVGFEQYEISAWARPGRRCRHNLLYWGGDDWWPVGPGAAGHLRGLRWRNVARLGDYLDATAWPPVTDVELPDPRRNAAEAIMMGMRLVEGLPLDRLARLLADLGDDGARAAAVDGHLAAGRLERTATHLRLTRPGRLLADTVISDLI